MDGPMDSGMPYRTRTGGHAAARRGRLATVLVAGTLVLLGAGSARLAIAPAVFADAPSPWIALQGGFHRVNHLATAPDGQPWACGSGVATDDGSGWRMTDPMLTWICSAMEMDGDGSGWVFAVPENVSFDPERANQGMIGRLEHGRVVSSVTVQEAFWNDSAEVSASDIWVAGLREGASPLFYHFDGDRWADRSPAEGWAGYEDAKIESIVMLHPDLGYAVASSGAIWRWDGSVWRNWQRVQTGFDIWARGMDALSPNDIWVVGMDMETDIGAFIARFDGRGWQTERRSGEELMAVAMAAPDRGWAVGDVALAYGGQSWRSLDWPDDWSPLFLLSAVEVAPDMEHALAGQTDNGQILWLTDESFAYVHGDSVLGRWPIVSVTSDGQGGAWTGGSRCAPDDCRPAPPLTMTVPSPIIRHWDLRGGQYEETLPRLDGTVGGLSRRAPHDVWAVGGLWAGDSPELRASGFILHREARTWRQVGDVTEVALSQLSHGADGSGWAIGAKGYTDPYEQSEVIQIDQDGWIVRDRLGPATRLGALKANAANDVWVGGARYGQSAPGSPWEGHAVLRQFDGRAWRDDPIDAAGITALDVLPSGLGWAGAWANGHWMLFERFDGAWTARQQVDAKVASLRLISDGEGFAGTSQGQILHLEVGQWHVEWTEGARSTSAILGIYDLDVLGWQSGLPVIGAAGSAETLLVRWVDGPDGSPIRSGAFSLFLPINLRSPGSRP
jgi:hypothetical protein